MGIQVGMGFDLNSPQYLDSRQIFKTLNDMNSANKNLFPEGFIVYNEETKKYYALKDNLEWEEFVSGIDRVFSTTQPVGHIKNRVWIHLYD